MNIRLQIPNELFCEISNYINDTSLLSKVSALSRNWYDRQTYEINRRITRLIPDWINYLNNYFKHDIFYGDCPDCPMKNKYVLYTSDKLFYYETNVNGGTTCPKHTIEFLKFAKIEKKYITYSIVKSVNKSPEQYCKCKVHFDNIKGHCIIMPFICIKYAIRDFIHEMSSE